VTVTGDRLAEHLAMLCRLPSCERALRSSASVSEFFARAAGMACETCGFTRGVVLSVSREQLTATQTAVLVDSASDALRRRVLSAPVALVPGSDEAEAVRRPDGWQGAELSQSVLQDALGLVHPAIGLIAPEDAVLAMLVVDRDDGAPDALDRAAVAAFAATVATALGQVIIRARVGELAAELQHLTVSAQALTAELLEAPLSLPSESGRGTTTFPHVDSVSAPVRADALSLLNAREREIALLLVKGRSNREIASELMLSTETVKDYVARVLRKLGVANRVEAVGRLLS
jgi:DNA-binding CsgD family transcriptional regulator